MLEHPTAHDDYLAWFDAIKVVFGSQDFMLRARSLTVRGSERQRV